MGRLSWTKCFRQHRTYAVTVRVNGALRISGLASLLIRGPALTLTLNRTIGFLTTQKSIQPHHTYALRMSLKAEAKFLGVESWLSKGLCSDINP